MEVQNNNISSNNKWQQLYLQINVSFNQYLQNRTKIQCWNKLFWRLNTWLGKDGPLSADSQKLINFYLQHKSQSSLLGNLIFQYKEIICKIYDLGMINAQSLDQGISSGGLADALYKKFQKDDGFSIGSFKVLLFCAQAVAIHICEFLKKFKQVNGSHILPINRKLCKIIRRKNLTYTSSVQFMKQCFAQPVFVLDSFMDNVKPILTNYLNIESLFEVTSPHFKHKKAFLTGSIQPGSQFIGKIINLNTIFDSTYTGRQMIQNKLKELTLGDMMQQNSDQIWSLTSCITQLQPALHSIVQKLPMFLRPKCNGDILSFCRNEMFPTFKYQVIKAGYVEKPMLSQYFTVFMNVGKNYFDLLCFPEIGNIGSQLKKYQKQNIFAIIDRLNVKYSKVRIGPKSLAVVPNNNYFIVSTDLNPKNQKTLTQIIYWNILPKDPQSITRSINIIQSKKKHHKNYYFIPTQQLFLDYLSHEYLKLNDLPTLQFIKQYLNTQINKQEQKVISIIKTQPKIQIKNKLINCQHRFCGFCKINFVNYFSKTNKNDYICMECSVNLRGDTIQQIYYIHNPHDIRYPLTLVKIYIDSRKHPGQSINNKYEKNVCCGQFIGSIDTEYCKGEQITQSQQTTNQNSPLKNYKKDQLFFMNRLKQLQIVSAQQMLASIAILQPSLSQRPAFLQKIRVLVKQIQDGQNFVRNIGNKYEGSNLVTDVIWAFRVKTNPQYISNLLN